MNVFPYVSTRNIGQFLVPVPTQNCAIREFASNRQLQLMLPTVENSIPNSFHNLFNLLSCASKGDCIGFYSILQLPSGSKLGKFLGLAGDMNFDFFFVLENVYCKSSDGIIKGTMRDYEISKVSCKLDMLKKWLGSFDGCVDDVAYERA